MPNTPTDLPKSQVPSLRKRISELDSVEKIDKMLSDLQQIKTISSGTIRAIEKAAEARKKVLHKQAEKAKLSNIEQQQSN
jgi:hypothetical protein